MTEHRVSDNHKNAPELPVGRFLKSKSLGGNRVILAVIGLGQSICITTSND
jgi:hypothetical protein